MDLALVCFCQLFDSYQPKTEPVQISQNDICAGSALIKQGIIEGILYKVRVEKSYRKGVFNCLYTDIFSPINHLG